ncbi:MAG: cytidine deaminase [Saccharofermentanales bacterium]|jgi:cytidine deaminase
MSEITDATKRQLIRQAFQAREGSYAPYSRFKVGAALMVDDGRVFLGANIENASYGATICAERTAAVQAAMAGYRAFVAMAVVGAPDGAKQDDFGFAYPCGICRQFLREFRPPEGDITVLVARTETDYRETTLNALLPDSFGPEDLE